jgi:hypothetical protein
MINLALQGGGAHGAFTWGVVDRLLDEPDIGFEGLSGTSAGAVNAVVLAHGLMDGGTKGRPGGAGKFLAPLLRGRHGFCLVSGSHARTVASWHGHAFRRRPFDVRHADPHVLALRVQSV